MRVETAARRRPGVPGQALRWAARTDLPDHLARLDLGAAADELRRFAPPDRSLTWLGKLDGWVLARAAGVLGPATVCDVDDLDDVRLHSIARLGDIVPSPPAELAGASGIARRFRARVDAPRWVALRRTVAGHAVVVVCSDLERRRSGIADAEVVPNGHPGPPNDVHARARAEAATAVLVGSFHYLPNLDAARWVAASIAPDLRGLDPSAVVRLVGDGPPEMARLAGTPGVSWTGPVADTAPHLAAASVALVPLRAGSGTRVKIVEAWAYGVAVVSTRIGAEGLDARDGEELVLAENAAALARAVHDLGRDDERRRHLVAAGRRRWQDSHSPDAVSAAVATVVRRALQSAARA